MPSDLTRPIHGKEAVAMLVVAALVIWGATKFFSTDSGEQQPAPKAAVPARVDFARPVFTTEEAIVCPLDRAFDQRVGHSLKDATEAALQTFGRTEKLREIGCEVLHDGVPVSVKPPTSDDVGWLESTTAPVYYWRFSLRN